MHYLADSNACIIAKELVDPAKDDMNSIDKMIGSGPFMLDKFVGLQVMRCVRNPDWFAKDDLADQGISDRPLVDAVEFIWQPADDTSIEVAFRSKQVDATWFNDNTTPDRVAQESGAFIDEGISGSWVNSRLLVADSPAAKSPFKDIRLRQALNLAVDRSRLGQQMYQGSCLLVPPVCSGARRVVAAAGRADQEAGLPVQAGGEGGGSGHRPGSSGRRAEARPSEPSKRCTRPSRTS